MIKLKVMGMFVREEQIELQVVELFKKQGYTYIQKNEAIKLREYNTSKVLLEGIFEEYLVNNYPKITQDIINKVILKLNDLVESSTEVSNKKFHKYLYYGIKIQDEKNNETKTYRLMNTKNISKNQFHITNQYICDTQINKGKKIPDVVVFINGVPISVFELKAPEAIDSELEAPFNQIKQYQEYIKSLFTYNAFNVISDGATTLYGTLTSSFTRYKTWKTSANVNFGSLEEIIGSLFKKAILVDVISNYIFYTEDKAESNKIMALPHQYYGVKKALNRIKEVKDGRGGIFWHTQGSGKSFSMLFLMKNYARIQKGVTFLIVTDRVDLDNQMENNCQAARKYLNQKIHKVTSISNLKTSLKNILQDGIYLSTVQKFQDHVGELSKRKDIVIIIDEAHRSHTNIEGKWIYDEGNPDVEKFGCAKYLRDAFTNAMFVGFTGTPIETKDKSTSEIFGPLISTYSLADAQDDKIILEITYESRRPDLYFKEEKLIELREKHKKYVKEMAKKTSLPGEIQKKINRELQKMENFIADEQRIAGIVTDLLEHYNQRKDFVCGKALLVTFSRKVAYQYYKELLKQNPKLKNNIKIIMTNSNQDDAKMSKIIGTNENRKEWAREFKDQNSEFKIAIVVDMWSTGFDVPCLDTLYLDKPLRMHNLMQTITRINRLFVDKKKGIEKKSAVVVDYIGVHKQLKDALKVYASKRTLKSIFKEVKTLVPQYMKNVDKIYSHYFGNINIPFDDIVKNVGTSRLSAIKNGINEIIKNKQIGEFVNQTKNIRQIFTQTSSSLNSLEKVKLHFLVVVRSQLIKLEFNKVNLTTINKELKKALDEAIEHDNFTIVNKYKGKQVTLSSLIKSIIDNEPDKEAKDLDLKARKNALEDAILMTKRINKVRADDISKKLKNLLDKYNNNFITQDQLIEDMKKLALEVLDGTKKEGWQKEYKDEEIAFYAIISDKKYTQDKVDKEKIKEIFFDLLKILNEQETHSSWIDFEPQRRAVRSEIIKLLRKHNYPPEGWKVKSREVVEQIFQQKRGE